MSNSELHKSNFGFTNKDWKELCKLYPEIKIPYFQEAPYYVKQLGTNDDTVYKKIMWYSIVKDTHESPGRYKMSVADKIIKELSDTYLEKLNNLPIPDNLGFSEKKLNLEDGKSYISVDLKEANYNSFKYALGITDMPDTWGEYMRLKNHPELFANSKSLRQLIFGNINPKRQVAYQKSLIIELLELAKQHDQNVLAVSHDELVIASGDNNENLVFLEQLKSFKVPLNIKKFTVDFVDSNDEQVIVKRYSDGKSKFHGIQGNRYFIHYSNIILGIPPTEADLYFEPEPGKLAKWVL